MDNNLKQRKPLHLKDFDYTGSASVYFITACTRDKQQHFLSGEVARLVTDELNHRRASLEITLFCYCIMPDHVHLLLSLHEGYGKSLQSWVAAFKRYTSKSANEFFGISPLWQKNFYEHVIRKEESLLETARYILNNPVRKGIVQEWSVYPFCGLADDFPL